MELPNTLPEALAPKLHPVATQRASEAIYVQIKDLILSGAFRPGDRLPSERALMETLQRSRPTIREALRMLEHSGLIRTAAGASGATVCAPGTDGVEESLMVMLQTGRVTVSELTEYRLVNDTAVARWAALRRTEADLARLAALLSDADTLRQERRFEAFIGRDAAFHRDLANAGGNTVAALLSQILSRLSEPKTLEGMRKLPDPEKEGMCQRIQAMHTEIFAAVRAADADRAEAAMRRHILAFGADLGG